MEKNHFVVKVTGPGTLSVKVGEKLKELGVKQLAYKPHCWHVETEYSKEELIPELLKKGYSQKEITLAFEGQNSFENFRFCDLF